MTEDSTSARPTPFMMLCGSLGAQVHMALGLIPDPVEKKGRIELDAARQGIDLLAMLEAKTAGNLEEEEKKLLGDLLMQLRMLFVEVSKQVAAAAEAAPEKAESEGGADEETGPPAVDEE